MNATIQQANWDTLKACDKLRRDIDAHVASVRAAKLLELTSLYEKQLDKALLDPVGALLDEASDNTWPAIRSLLQRETKSATTSLSSALTAFDLDNVTVEKMTARLEDYARSIVKFKAEEESGRVLILMKDRFTTLFSRDSDSMPRVWTGKEHIRAITKTARSASLKLLSVMAAIRLDEETDNIQNTLSLALVDSANSAGTSRSIQPIDPLASSSWEEVSPEKTLITPVLCKSLWRQFISQTEYTVTQAIANQEASRRNNRALPSPWAILAVRSAVTILATAALPPPLGAAVAAVVCAALGE